MPPAMEELKRFFVPGTHNGTSEENGNPSTPNVGMEHPDRKEAGPNLNGSSAEPVLGSHGKPLMTTGAGHPISDDNNR